MMNECRFEGPSIPNHCGLSCARDSLSRSRYSRLEALKRILSSVCEEVYQIYQSNDAQALSSHGLALIQGPEVALGEKARPATVL